MGVDADVASGDAARHLADDALHLVGQGSAIGVAAHDPSGPGLMGRDRAAQRVVGIGFVAVEEMLAIHQRFAAALPCGADALGDARDVVVERTAERHMHVVVPGLGHEHDRIGRSLQGRREARIVARRASGALRHAEGGQLRAKLRRIGEEGRIERIGARIATLDVIEAEVVEQGRDRPLVGEREIDPGGLGAVAERGVEQRQVIARCRWRHGGGLAPASRSSSVVLASHSPLTGTELRLWAL